MLRAVRAVGARALRGGARFVEDPRGTVAAFRSEIDKDPAAGLPIHAPPLSFFDLEVVRQVGRVPERGNLAGVSLILTVDVLSAPSVARSESLADVAAAAGYRVVVVPYVTEGALLEHGRAAGVIPADRDRPEALRGALAVGWSAAVAHAASITILERAVVADASLDFDVEALERLVGLLGGGDGDGDGDGDQQAAVAQAVVLRRSGVVQSAGGVFVRRGFPPAPLLEGYPSEDARRAGTMPLFAADLPLFAIRTADIVPTVSTDDLPMALAEISLRAAERSGLPIVSALVGKVYSDADVARVPDSGAQALLRSLAVVDEGVTASTALLRAGLAGGRAIALPGLLPSGFRVPRVTLERVPAPPSPGLVVDESAPSLRWSLKTAAHPSPEGDSWGDTIFARDLAEALRRRGQIVVIDNQQTHVRTASEHLDDVSLAIRGLIEVPLHPTAVNALWVISHPDLVTGDELAGYDLRFAAGAVWAERVSGDSGLPIVPLLQATDPSRFAPGEIDPAVAADVLFVGRTRGVDRPMVRFAVEAGLAPQIWGDGWDGVVDPKLVRGDYLAPERVPAAYRSAGIVLSDHWPDMARDGFIANRVFDAAASGAVVITDAVQGVEEVLSGAVRVAHDASDVRRIVSEMSAMPDDATARVARARRIGAANSFDARADELLRRIVPLARSRP